MGADPCARHIGQDRERRKADRIILPLVFLPHKKKDCVTQLPVPDIHLTAGRSFCRSGLGLPVVRCGSLSTMCSGKVPSAVVPTVISETLFGDKAKGVTKKKVKIAGKKSVGIAFLELFSPDPGRDVGDVFLYDAVDNLFIKSRIKWNEAGPSRQTVCEFPQER